MSLILGGGSLIDPISSRRDVVNIAAQPPLPYMDVCRSTTVWDNGSSE